LKRRNINKDKDNDFGSGSKESDLNAKMIKEKPSEKTEKALEHFGKINPLNDHAAKISQEVKYTILKYHAILLEELGRNKTINP